MVYESIVEYLIHPEHRLVVELMVRERPSGK